MNAQSGVARTARRPIANAIDPLTDMDEQQQLLAAKLNLESGRLTWKELERHFARGVVLKIAADLDLIEVARVFANDDNAQVDQWMQSGAVAKAEIDDAAQWHEEQATFWAIVIAPFVLVQREQR